MWRLGKHRTPPHALTSRRILRQLHSQVQQHPWKTRQLHPWKTAIRPPVVGEMYEIEASVSQYTAEWDVLGWTFIYLLVNQRNYGKHRKSTISMGHVQKQSVSLTHRASANPHCSLGPVGLRRQKFSLCGIVPNSEVPSGN